MSIPMLILPHVKALFDMQELLQYETKKKY